MGRDDVQSEHPVSWSDATGSRDRFVQEVRAAAREGLESGELHRVIDVGLPVTDGIRKLTLFPDHHVIVLRADHPAIAGDADLTLAAYTQAPHVLEGSVIRKRTRRA